MTIDLHQLTISSTMSDCARTAWYLPSVTSARRLCLFLDGEFYVHRMQAPALIRELESQELLPPMACLFVSHVDGAARHRDYTCSARFADYLVNDVLPWLRAQNATVAAHDVLLGGTSLSGLQAAYTALSQPHLFPRVLCQSGSFWWNNEWLREHVQQLATLPAKFWISVGDQETATGVSHPPSGLLQEIDQITACENFATTVGERGCDTFYHRYQGGHDMPSWAEELPGALRWLLQDTKGTQT